METNGRTDAFEEGLVEFLEGTPPDKLKHKRPDVYHLIDERLGYRHYVVLHKLYLDFVVIDGMPTKEEAKKIKNFEEILEQHYNNNYNELKKQWEPLFKEIWLSDDDKEKIKMDAVGIPKEILNRIDGKIVKDSVIKLYREHPEERLDLTHIFEKLKMGEIKWHADRMHYPERFTHRKGYPIAPTFEDALESSLDYVNMEATHREENDEEEDYIEE